MWWQIMGTLFAVIVTAPAIRSSRRGPQPLPCNRCRFDSGEWLGYVPDEHSCEEVSS